MVDNEAQIQHLEDFANSTPAAASLSWDVFIKIDVGSHRAGMETSSPALPKLVRRVEESPVASVYGFYCHAGHSYGCRTTEAAADVLKTELGGVVKAAENVKEQKGRKVVLSVGSTPTAHVVREIGSMPDNMEVELHAGMPGAF
jgi:D-serine deaminase-like pyridoxal phosphate-dependent protein